MIAAAIGVVIGLLTIRLGNLYVALVTLTFGLLMERLVFNLEHFAQFGAGVAVDRPEFAISDRAFTYMALAFFAVIAILIVNLRRSTTGLALNAVRWSETASRTMGLSVIQMKMLVSGLAAFVAGVGGGLYAVAHKQAIPLDYATLAGPRLAGRAGDVRRALEHRRAARRLRLRAVAGVRPDIPAAELARGRRSPSCCSVSVPSSSPRTPRARCTSRRWGCRVRSTLSGARAVPAATAIAGRHDPRLAGDGQQPPPPDEPAEPTAEVTQS